MLAGGVGGFFMEAVNYPLETIKSRIQASSSRVNLVEVQKGRGLFRGFSTVFYVAFPGNALYFLGYDGSMYLFRRYLPRSNEHFSSMLSAAVGEVLWSIFRNPFEVIKQQMQIGLDSQVTSTCRNILKAKGFAGFYSGFLSLLLREIPYTAIQMPIYEQLKKATTRRTGKKPGEFSVFENWANGAVAGAICSRQ